MEAAENVGMVDAIMEEARLKCVGLKNRAETARMQAFAMLDAHNESVKQNMRADDQHIKDALKKLHRLKVASKRARLEDERKQTALQEEVDALQAKARKIR